MGSRWFGMVAAVLLAAGSAMAGEITFQATEIDLGQDVNTATAITGDEWLTFGIDMNGGSLVVYGPPNPDPFPPPTDQNGVFEVADGAFEIVFTDKLISLELDWFSPSGAPSTIIAYDENGAAIQLITNPGGATQNTELLNGAIKRILIQADPGTLCVANLRFELFPGVPTLTSAGLSIMALMLLLALATVVGRGRPAAGRI